MNFLISNVFFFLNYSLDFKTYDHFIYIAPWGRMGASLVGLLIGYALFNFKRKQKVIVIKRVSNSVIDFIGFKTT